MIPYLHILGDVIVTGWHWHVNAVSTLDKVQVIMCKYFVGVVMVPQEES